MDWRPLKHPEAPKSILISTPVWGREYTRFYRKVVIPNLLTAGNLPAIASRVRCRYIVYTDEEMMDFISRDIGPLNGILDLQFASIRKYHNAGKYGTLTTCYNDAVAPSRRRPRHPLPILTL